MKQNFIIPSLAKLYSKQYDARMIEWRRLGAIDKAENIERVLSRSRLSANRVLEIGAGTGEVLRQLARRNVGVEFHGIEIGTERSKPREEVVSGKPIILSGYDGKTAPFDAGTFDFVYATHVLEHVTDERQFLSELRRLSSGSVYVEVPLELNLRTSFSALQRTLNIGHINSYCLESFILTLETSGLEVIDFEIFDQRFAAYRFVDGTFKSALKWGLRYALLRLLGPHVAQKLTTYQCGALCRARSQLDIV
jgi:ubiquinone/menaquinone biosynthesis C-methylase UbiE